MAASRIDSQSLPRLVSDGRQPAQTAASTNPHA
jgi:hypothetical protein